MWEHLQNTHAHTHRAHAVLAEIEEKNSEDPTKASWTAARYILMHKNQWPLVEVIGKPQTLCWLINCDTPEKDWITPDDSSAGKLP